MPEPGPDPSTEFLGHLLKCQHSLRNYLFSLHPHAEDLDDLVQQTAMTLWQGFDRYDRSREFLPWALRVGHFEVLRLRKQRSRDRLVFSENLLELLASETPVENDREAALAALDACLEKLDASGREVLLARYYGEGHTVAALATRRKTSVHQLYRRLAQARVSLATCVRRQLHLDGNPQPT